MPDLSGIRLSLLCGSPRTQQLGELDAYADCRQYDGLRYNWDGQLMGYAGEADIGPGYYVAMDKRRPNTRFNLGKLIRTRLSAMALGEDRWPEVTVPGDPDAEDYCKALALESKLQQRMQEARDKGGAMGTAVVSFSFLEGKPRVKCHDAKHMHPVRWNDRDEYVLGAVVKAYRYTRTVYERDTGRPKQVGFFACRYWDENVEIVWDPIPEEIARRENWSSIVKSYAVQHGYGECPVYWCQNLPDSEREDGVSDIDGLGDTFDQINRLLSATTKGTIANVDPTLVVHDEQGKNPGLIRKGTGQAIFSPGGAEYLELKGDSVKTAQGLVEGLVQQSLAIAGVVVGDPVKMGVAALSAQALRMLYLPMCNQCDLLRPQYGQLIVSVLRGMLRAARLIGNTEPGPVQLTADGIRIQSRPVVILPPKITKVDPDPGSDSGTTEEVKELTPGESDRLELKWPPYFQASMPDILAMVQAATTAKGQTISQRTAIKFTSTPFGVSDIDKEQAEIDVEKERDALLMQMPGDDGGGPPGAPGTPPEE
jgi:hypothetical protein